MHRLVAERQVGVDTIEAIGHVDAARPDRPLEHDRGIGDGDVVDGNRRCRSLAIRLLLLLLDQPGDRPRLAVPLQVQHGPVQTDVVDRHAAGDHLEHVVVEAEVLDRHDLSAVHRDADVLHLDAEEQVPAQPLDRQPSVQIPRRFGDDVAAQPVLEPRRLRNDDRRRRRADDQRQNDDQHVNQPPRDPHDPSTPNYRLAD